MWVEVGWGGSEIGLDRLALLFLSDSDFIVMPIKMYICVLIVELNFLIVISFKVFSRLCSVIKPSNSNVDNYLLILLIYIKALFQNLPLSNLGELYERRDV